MMPINHGNIDDSRIFFDKLKSDGITSKNISENITDYDLKELRKNIKEHVKVLKASLDPNDVVYIKEANDLLATVSEVYREVHGVKYDRHKFIEKIISSVFNINFNLTNFDSVDVKKDTIFNYFNTVFSKDKDLEKALKYEVKHAPEFSQVFYLLGLLLESHGNNDEAIEIYKNAVVNDHPQAMLQLAMLQEKKGNFDEALHLYETLYFKRSYDIREKIGLMHELKGEYAEALSIYKQCDIAGLLETPGDFCMSIPLTQLKDEDIYFIGALSFERKDLNKAYECFTKLADKGDWHGYYGLGQVYQAWDQLDLALKYYKLGDPKDALGKQAEIVSKFPWDASGFEE